MASLAAAQAARDDLQEKLRGQPWFRGADLTQLKCLGPNPYEVQIGVDTPESANALRACPSTPRRWMGVPLSFAVVGDLALGAMPTTTQDYANVALGAMTMVGTFLLGKIVVESIIEGRQEHFKTKGQPKAAVKAKETTADGIVKVLGTAYSMYMLSQELPLVLNEAKKLLE